MYRGKVVVVLILAIFVLVLILQNLRSVESRILFFSLDLPLAVLQLITLAVGFILGFLVALLLGRHRTG